MPAAKSKSPKIISSTTVAEIGPDGGLIIRPADGRSTTATAAVTPKRVNPKRREDIPDGGRIPEASSSTISSELPIDSSNSTATGATEESPAIILQGLMSRFIELKEKGGKAEAFKSLQRSFALNAALLSPYFIPLKDLMNLIMELETFIGKSGEHVGKTPEQLLRSFLQTSTVGDDNIVSRYMEGVKVLDKSS